MTEDTWEAQRDAKVAKTTASVKTALDTLPSTTRLATQLWDAGEAGIISQPVDPAKYGIDILYAEANPLVDGSVIVVSYGRHTSDTVNVGAYAPHDYDADRGYADKGWGVMPRDFYRSSVHTPRFSYLNEKLEAEAEVSVTGGGSRDPHRVASAARVLTIAAHIAMQLNAELDR